MQNADFQECSAAARARVCAAQCACARTATAQAALFTRWHAMPLWRVAAARCAALRAVRDSSCSDVFMLISYLLLILFAPDYF